MQNSTDEKLTEIIRLVATIPDIVLQRAIVNAVLDLQDCWHEVVSGFVSRHRGLTDAAAEHVDCVASEHRINLYPNTESPE